jgi:hypothetical protein
MWDSGLRSIPLGIVPQAKTAVTEHVRDTELLSLAQLAGEFGIHERTLRDAARWSAPRAVFNAFSVWYRFGLRPAQAPIEGRPQRGQGTVDRGDLATFSVDQTALDLKISWGFSSALTGRSPRTSLSALRRPLTVTGSRKPSAST